jgi:hypothetical protein
LIAIIAIILGILTFNGLFNPRNPDSFPSCGTVPAGTPCFGPSPSGTVEAATAAPAITGAPTTDPMASATPSPQPSASFVEDTRLAPPEDFSVVNTAGGKHTVSWVWPSGQELDPNFFRVSVQGEPYDFDFTGPGDYEVEVPTYCGSNPNYLTLDAFNTDVQPEANSQADDIHEIDPGC